jgi:hypothetical protein
LYHGINCRQRGAKPFTADSVTYKQPNWNATFGRQMFSLFEDLAVSMDDGHSAGDMGYPAGTTRTAGGRAKNYPALQGGRLRLFNKYLYTGAEYIWGLADSHDKAWKAVIKTPDTKKPGDMQYAVEYRNIQRNALDYNSCTGGSINSTYVGLSGAYKSITYGDYTYWALSVKRQLTKDVAVTLFYEKYNPQSHGTSGVDDTQVEDHVYRLQLDYAF